jgi:hypothetical protein
MSNLKKSSVTFLSVGIYTVWARKTARRKAKGK